MQLPDDGWPAPVLGVTKRRCDTCRELFIWQGDPFFDTACPKCTARRSARPKNMPIAPNERTRGMRTIRPEIDLRVRRRE